MRTSLGQTVAPAVFMCLLFGAGVAAADRDDAKPLPSTAVLEFSIGHQIVVVATAKTLFTVDSTYSEGHADRKEKTESESAVDLKGRVTPGKGGKPWTVEIQGTYAFFETHVEAEDLENGPVHEQVSIHAKIFLNSSVYLRPGERKLLTRQSGQEVWVTLQLPDER